jgi:hypothetical protein
MPIGRPIINGCFRETLSQKDIRFVATTLAGTEADTDALLRLLTDDGSRDMILDSPELGRKLDPLEGKLPPLSLELYFYIALRPELKARELDRPELADYLASILAREMRARFPRLDEERMAAAEGKKTAPRAKPRPLTADMVEAMTRAQGYAWFVLAVAAADQALLLTAVFPDTLYTPNRPRVAPGLNYYQTVGKTYYHQAAEHQVAGEFEITGILSTLGDHFDQAREALAAVKTRLIPATEVAKR